MPSANEPRLYTSNDELDSSDPWLEDWLSIMTRREEPILLRRRIRALERELQELREDKNALVVQFGERQQAVESLATQLKEKDQAIEDLSRSLNAIYRSRSWKIATRLKMGGLSRLPAMVGEADKR